MRIENLIDKWLKAAIKTAKLSPDNTCYITAGELWRICEAAQNGIIRQVNKKQLGIFEARRKGEKQNG